MKAAFERAWSNNASWLSLLKPLEFLFRRTAENRRAAYLSGKKLSYRAPVPVIVVGNISVGGVGKTPLVIALAEYLSSQGFRPGIVSRGYGAAAGDFPRQVLASSNPQEVGDEPLLIARRTNCPMFIDPNRPQAIQALLKSSDCNLVISDDGLQHYAMARDIEIAVVDGQQGLGNGALLPAGPLREPPERLHSVSFIVTNGSNQSLALSAQHPPQFEMQVKPVSFVNLKTGEALKNQHLLRGKTNHAVAGIGNPQRFFNTLRALGLEITEHPFPDHHQFVREDLNFNESTPVIMSEKDAVKCLSFAEENCWYLPIDAQLPEDFYSALLQALEIINS